MLIGYAYNASSTKYQLPVLSSGAEASNLSMPLNDQRINHQKGMGHVCITPETSKLPVFFHGWNSLVSDEPNHYC